MKHIAHISLLLSLVALGGCIFIFATGKKNDDQMFQEAIRSNYRIYAPVIPDTLDFAGEPVPIDEYYVRESLDKEMLSIMFYHSNMIQYIKRANRVFPEIERILEEEHVPTDFKYLCVIESGLTNVTSPARAQGYWQFMESTGKSFGLEISDEIDMRNDLEASTHAACRFLKQLRQSLGSWTAAAAAYNCGEGGLRKRFNLEQTYNYYHTRLNTETGRYVYRILAMKQIMTHLQDYGFNIRQCDLYPVIPFRTVSLSGQNVDLYSFARQNNCSYKLLREFNPWITTDNLKNKARKTYTIKLPEEGCTKMSNLTQGRKDTDILKRI